MAKEIQNTSNNITQSFVKGLNKDSDPSFVQEGMWTHAVNAVNNTSEGDLGTLSNETSNFLCATTGNTMIPTVANKYIIGAIYLYSDKWIIFTAGHDAQGKPAMSEIGLLEEERCIYRPIAQDACLGFDKRYLISGVSKFNSDCTWQIYFADGLNPDRFFNVGDPKLWPPYDAVWAGYGINVNYYLLPNGSKMLWPSTAWKQKCTPGNCQICSDDNKINCDGLRLARLMETPCLNLTLGQQGGTLANGTYFAVIAYSIEGQKVTDYFSQSNNQFIYYPNDLQGSLTLEISADTTSFDEFILVIVQNINQGTVAKQIGIYSTSTEVISIDQIDAAAITIPIEQIPIQTPVYEKSDQISEVNNYLLRVGPTSRFDFNYQPLANLIKSKWSAVEYPASYYVDGGNKTNYLRDEVYAFFIRWIYDTGDKTSSYHIPGRAPKKFIVPQTGLLVDETDDLDVANTLATSEQVYDVYNTASPGPYPSTMPGATLNSAGEWVLDDGGVLIASGEMGYWESTESYPNNNAEVWNSSSQCWTGIPIDPITGLPIPSIIYDLCGEKIRHHKFPENFFNTPNNNSTSAVHFRTNPNSSTTGEQYFIRNMGVYFENIILPKDNDGNDIPGIVGYEILRGSREGNKTIIAKGMINNFRSYEIKGSAAKGRTGLYANYPFNTINPIGPNAGSMTGVTDPYINVDNQFIPKDIVSFHSPDTMFSTPYLSTTELKLYGNLSGYSTQQFIEPNRHPKFKLLADYSIIPIYITGFTEAIVSMLGKRTLNQPDLGPYGKYFTTPIAFASGSTPVPIDYSITQNSALGQISIATGVYNQVLQDYYPNDALVDAVISLTAGYENTIYAQANNNVIDAVNQVANAAGMPQLLVAGSIELPAYAYLPLPLRIAQGLQQAIFYFSEGADVALQLIYAILPYRQYALQSIAHGFYGNMSRNALLDGSNPFLFRFNIEDSFYIRDNIQNVSRYQVNNTFYQSYSINNLKRSDTAVIRTKSGPYYDGLFPQGVNTGPSLLNTDKSLVTLGTVAQANDFGQGSYFAQGARPDFTNIDTPFSLPIGSHYGALKGRVKNQYGQLDSIKQIIITPCEQTITNTAPLTYTCNNEQYTLNVIVRTPILFNGDTYINRYTEKNTMFYYYDWLYAQPDGFEYNYYIHQMIPTARFNVNSIKYDISNMSEVFNPGAPQIPGTGAKPSQFYNLDFYVNNSRKYDYDQNQPEPNDDSYPGFFGVKESKFYLANSSVRDFFVESDVLIDFRENSDIIGEKHYDPYRYTDYQSFFDMDPNIITRGNIYRYDYSLSMSKLYNQYFSSGNLQNRYYDPKVSSLCYTYYPDRIIYSLPQQQEAIKDSWFIYLVNNYVNFKSQISGVKSINKSGIFITFKNDSPLMYQGLDQLQTDLGTKLTIGDGGLFSQPGQSVTNADKSYEYGSSQNRLSIVNTPAGIYYVSQNQGKIFNYSQGLKEISQVGLKWWFNLFLPYKLTEAFPEYPYVDNPVVGIGIQAVYDNQNTILYFTKKDYQLKVQYLGRVAYIDLVTSGKGKGLGDYFTLDGKGRYQLGDSLLFDDASWTVSYDPKNNFWLSFHDWHPDYVIPTKSTFLTSKTNTLWKHNFLCDNFCNYYGSNYPFEIEIPVITGQTITTLKSIDYILECYRRQPNNCVDQHHVLDFNFDHAVIYNSEQVSGYLNLNLFPKNNVTLSLQYPKLNPSNLSSYDVLFSKEENKYRLNQFWDITKDRAEFPIGSDYPPTGPVIPGTTILNGNYGSENTWITSPNGYSKVLNTANLNYDKPQLQRKKFRHYLNFINLRRDVSGDINMVLKLANTKNQISLR